MNAETPISEAPPLAPSSQYRSDLRPLPMRVTPQQYDRLRSARDRDGLSVAEHVRRALDFYLARIEGSPLPSADAGLPPGDIADVLAAVSPVHPGGYVKKPRPKVRRK